MTFIIRWPEVHSDFASGRMSSNDSGKASFFATRERLDLGIGHYVAKLTYTRRLIRRSQISVR